MSRLRFIIRKVRVEELLLLLIFIFVSIVAFYLGIYAVKMMNLQKASTALYSPNALAFRVKNLEGTHQLLMDSVKGIEDIALIQKGRNELLMMFSGAGYTIPPIIKGRFLDENDFSARTHVAVLGNEFSATNVVQIIARDGKKYASYYGMEYEIIGTVGFGYSSPVNTTLYRNFTPADTDTSHMGSYILDAPTAKAVKAVYAQLKTVIEQKGGKFVEMELPQSKVNISQFFQVELLNLVMIAFAIFTVVLATVPITLYWASRRRKDMAVKRFLGFSSMLIIRQIFMRFMGLAIVGFLIGYGCFWILVPLKIMIPPSLFSPQTGLAFLMTLLFNIATALVPVVQSLKIDPGDVLRRDG